MRQYFGWFFFCVWLIGISAWANPPLEQSQVFYARLMARYQAGNLRGVLQQAAEEPQCALYLLRLLEQSLPGLPAGEQESSRRVMTLLARGLALSNQPEPLADLQARGLLSHNEAGYTWESAPVAALKPGQEEAIEWEYWGRPNIERLVDLGNFRQCAQLATVYSKFLEDSGLSESPSLALFIREATLLAGDFPHQQEQRQQMLNWAEASPTELCRLQSLFAITGLDNGRPDVVRAALIPLEQALHTVSAEQQALARFILETARFQLHLRETGHLEWSVFCQAHQAAWSALAKYHGHRHGDTRLWQRGAAFWLSILYANTATDAQGAEAASLYQSDIQLVQRLSTEALKEYSYCAQLEDFSRLLALQLEDSDILTRPAASTEKLLELTRVTLGHYRQWLQDDQQVQNQICPPAIRTRLGQDFQLDFVHGDLSRVESLYLALLHLLHPETAPMQEIVSQSHLALQHQGQPGFKDARYMLLLHLKTRPAQAEFLLSSLENEWRKIKFRPGLVAVAFMRGRSLAAQGHKSEALLALEKACGLLEQYLTDFGGGLVLINQYRSDYEFLGRLYSANGQVLQAFATMERLNNLQSVQRGSAALLLRPEFTAVRQLSDQTAALENQSAVLASLGSDPAPATRQVAQNRRQLHQVVDRLLSQSPRFRTALTVPVADLSGAQKYLPTNTALIQYLPGPEALYIFLVTRKDVKLFRVVVTATQIDQAVDRVRTRIDDFRLKQELLDSFDWKDRGSASYQDYTRPLLQDLHFLYSCLLHPLEAELAGYKVLAFVPGGNLYYLPVSCLVKDIGLERPDFVVDHWQSVMLLKASDVKALGKKHNPGAKGILAMANPDGTLPGAEREVRIISQFFPRNLLYLGKQASADCLRAIPVGISYLHLATHGILNAKNPVASYLVVAGAALRISDIYGLKLENMRLVTLSACKTAVAQGYEGGSDITSLAQAFSVAGGRAVLASLWDVSDEGTADLMTALYPRIARGENLSEALQQAQLHQLQQKRFQHPYYWSAFSLFGDWR